MIRGEVTSLINDAGIQEFSLNNVKSQDDETVTLPHPWSQVVDMF